MHAGYPLASKMGGELLDFMLNHKFEDSRYQSSAENLIEIFGKNPNIEDLVSAIEERLDKLENAETYDERMIRIILRDSLTHISQMLREWFYILHDRPANLYAQLAGHVINPGDTVITFNYDDSLDRELKRAGKWDLSHGYGFPLGNNNTQSEVLLLKLHGSVNWLLSLFGGNYIGFFSGVAQHDVAGRQSSDVGERYQISGICGILRTSINWWWRSDEKHDFAWTMQTVFC